MLNRSTPRRAPANSFLFAALTPKVKTPRRHDARMVCAQLLPPHVFRGEASRLLAVGLALLLMHVTYGQLDSFFPQEAGEKGLSSEALAPTTALTLLEAGNSTTSSRALSREHGASKICSSGRVAPSAALRLLACSLAAAAAGGLEIA